MTYRATFDWAWALTHAQFLARKYGRRYRVLKIGPYWAITEATPKW